MSTSGVGKQSTPDEVPKLDVVLKTADISVLETAREGLSAVGEIFKANEQKGHSALQALCQRSFPGGSTWRYTPHEVLVALFPEGTPTDVENALTLLDGTLESRRMHRPYDEMPIHLQKDLALQQGLLENEAMTSEPSIVDGKDWLQDPAWVKEVTDWLENPPAYAHDPNPVEWNRTLGGWKKAWGELQRTVQANEPKELFSPDPTVRAKQYQQYVARLHACWVAAEAATKACGQAPPSAKDPPAAWKAGLIFACIYEMVMRCSKGWSGQVAQLEEMCGLKSQSGTLHPLLQGLIAARDLRREWAQFTLNQGLQASGWDPRVGSNVHYEQALKNVGNDRFGLGYTPEDIQPEGDVDQAVDYFLNAQVFWDRAERKYPELIDLLQSKYASFDQSQREKLFELLNEAYREDVGHHPALQMAPKEQGRRLAALRPLIDQANRVADPEERRQALSPLFKEMTELGVPAPVAALSCREAAEKRLRDLLLVKMLGVAWNQTQNRLRREGIASGASVEVVSQLLTGAARELWIDDVELEAQAIRWEIEKSLVDPVVRAEALDVLAEVETRVKSQESELLAERGPGSLHEALQDLQRSELESVVEKYEMSHRTAVAEMVEHWPSYEARLQESSLNRLLVDDESERLTQFGAKVWATLCGAVTLSPEGQVGTPIARWIDTQPKEVMSKLLGLYWGPLDPRVAELLPGRPELEEYVKRLRQGGRSVAHLLKPENLAKIRDEDLYRLVPQGLATIKQLLDMAPEQVACLKHPLVEELLRADKCTVTQVLGMTPEQKAALQSNVLGASLKSGLITITDLMEMRPEEIAVTERLLTTLKRTYEGRCNQLARLISRVGWRGLDKLQQMTPEQAAFVATQQFVQSRLAVDEILKMTPEQIAAMSWATEPLAAKMFTVAQFLRMRPDQLAAVKSTLLIRIGSMANIAPLDEPRLERLLEADPARVALFADLAALRSGTAFSSKTYFNKVLDAALDLDLDSVLLLKKRLSHPGLGQVAHLLDIPDLLTLTEDQIARFDGPIVDFLCNNPNFTVAELLSLTEEQNRGLNSLLAKKGGRSLLSAAVALRSGAPSRRLLQLFQLSPNEAPLLSIDHLTKAAPLLSLDDLLKLDSEHIARFDIDPGTIAWVTPPMLLRMTPEQAAVCKDQDVVNLIMMLDRKSGVFLRDVFMNMTPVHLEALSKPAISRLLSAELLDGAQLLHLTSDQIDRLCSGPVNALVVNRKATVDQALQLKKEHLAALNSTDSVLPQWITDGRLPIERLVTMTAEQMELLNDRFVRAAIESGRLTLDAFIAREPQEIAILKDQLAQVRMKSRTVQEAVEAGWLPIDAASQLSPEQAAALEVRQFRWALGSPWVRQRLLAMTSDHLAVATAALRAARIESMSAGPGFQDTLKRLFEMTPAEVALQKPKFAHKGLLDLDGRLDLDEVLNMTDQEIAKFDHEVFRRLLGVIYPASRLANLSLKNAKRVFHWIEARHGEGTALYGHLCSLVGTNQFTVERLLRLSDPEIEKLAELLSGYEVSSSETARILEMGVLTVDQVLELTLEQCRHLRRCLRDSSIRDKLLTGDYTLTDILRLPPPH